ncbi:peptidase U32 family protein [Sporocytophaga myxococcoides]|uniref:peptidase U32 family protein n=1 Tax=Sporocytophaga myxococcoides TaxID=153721 RepID=UPI0004056FB3|nr:peptidase U32 family protein [Sporocytophaga myxococcoides]
MKDKIEVMAPAGSFEAFMAAIQGGADSIYFGVDQLNMRARAANNFLLEDLPEIGRIAREHNVKTYVTLNTILYDHDMSIMKRIIDSIKENGLTAIIAADHAAIQYAFTKGVEVHLSTQVNVTNLETVKFYAMFSDVIVLSRELSLKQIKDITDGIKRENVRGPKGELVRIEIFAHGALCMAVSGKCYLSLHTANSSANRGACQQNCRRTYKVIDLEDGHELEIDNEYIMSPKDLCTINFLDEVIASGVTVLKLEGRGRAPEYVKTVTKCYREAVDAYLDDTFTDEKLQDWMNRLETVYNRGFWSGYYLGQKLGEWTNKHGSSATTRKIFLGKGVRYFPKVKVAEFILETHKLKIGDEILIIGPTTGVVETTITEIRVDDKQVDEVGKGISFSIPLEETIRSSDKIYKVVPAND